MKKLLLLSSAIVAAGPALAADLPMKAPPMAAAVPYSWTGCHVGGHIGGAWDRTTYTFRTPARFSPTTPLVPGTAKLRTSQTPVNPSVPTAKARSWAACRPVATISSPAIG